MKCHRPWSVRRTYPPLMSGSVRAAESMSETRMRFLLALIFSVSV